MNLGPISTPLNPGSFFKSYIPLEKGAVEGFAVEMARRASQAELPVGASRTVDDEGLKKAIEGAVGFVEDNFGDRAARTFMGIVLKNASGRAIGEEAMGDAFVNGLEFLDRAFGIEAGDKAMEYFNGELNNAFNGYYQNGRNESFLAVELDQAKEALGQAAGKAVAGMMKKFTENAVDPDALLMDQAASDLDESLEEGPGSTVADETSAGESAVDASGLPLADGGQEAGAAGTAPVGVQSGTAAPAPDGTAADKAAAVEERPVAGARRRGRGRGRGGRRVRRKRVDSGNPYDKSGLTPGQVLDKKI